MARMECRFLIGSHTFCDCVQRSVIARVSTGVHLFCMVGRLDNEAKERRSEQTSRCCFHTHLVWNIWSIWGLYQTVRNMSEGAVTITEEIEELKKKLALLGKPKWTTFSRNSIYFKCSLSFNRTRLEWLWKFGLWSQDGQLYYHVSLTFQAYLDRFPSLSFMSL